MRSSVRSTSATRRRAAPRACLGFPTTDEKGSPDGVGRYNHFSGSGGSSIYWSPTTGAHSVHGCDPGQVGVAGLGDRAAGLSDHGREGAPRTGWGGTTTSPVRAGPRSTGRRRPGRTGSTVRSGPSGRPWAGRQGRWAIRPPTRKAPRTGWGGTTTSPVRVGTRSTGRRRPGRTLSSVRSGPSGRRWAGRRAAGLSDHGREGPAGRCGAVQPLLRFGRGLDLLVAEDRGALMSRVRSGPSGRPWAGRESRLGYPTTRRVLGFRRPGIGLSTRPPDMELEHQQGYWIAVPASVQESRTDWRLDLAGLGPIGPDLCGQT